MIQRTIRGTLRKGGTPQQSYVIERQVGDRIECDDLNAFLQLCSEEIGSMLEIRVRIAQ